MFKIKCSGWDDGGCAKFATVEEARSAFEMYTKVNNPQGKRKSPFTWTLLDPAGKVLASVVA